MPDIQSSTPGGRSEVSFSDPKHGWIVAAHEAGTFGEVWSTSDGGATWTALGERISAATGWLQYSSVAALSTDHVVLGGEQHVAVTFDGGGSWRGGSPPPTQVMTFVDDENGFGCNPGDAGEGSVTSDGGRSWTPRKVRSSGRPLGLNDADFAADGSLVACGGLLGHDMAAFLCLSSDGGRTWVGRNWDSGHGSFVTAVDTWGSDCIWAGSEQGVLRTLDRGASWEFFEWRRDRFVPEDIDFADRDSGWAVGSIGPSGPVEGIILRTTDGGATWEQDEVPGHPGPIVVQSVCAVDARHAFATGIVESTDETVSVVGLRFTEN